MYVCVIYQPVVAVSEKQLKGLMDKYSAEKLYQLTGPVVALRDLDLNLNKGDLVAVISEMDTRGDRRRWLVDAGGIRYSSSLNTTLMITRSGNLIITFVQSRNRIAHKRMQGDLEDRGRERDLIVF